MKTTSTLAARYIAAFLLAFTAGFALLLAGQAVAAPAADTGAIASQYAAWAGGRANADALVNGMRAGTTVTITTFAPDRSISIAGFTPRAPMTNGEVRDALAAARTTLGKLGIRQPSAEQIQAALIGGEVELRKGATTVLSGTVPVRGTSPPGSIAANR